MDSPPKSIVCDEESVIIENGNVRITVNNSHYGVDSCDQPTDSSPTQH